MINKSMNDKSPILPKKHSSPTGKKPNEFNGVYVSSHVKIFDPNSKEVFVQKRGDN
jgi:hypothetical protein